MPKKEKRGKKHKRIVGRYRVYMQALPEIIKYQVLTKALLALLVWGLGSLAQKLLGATGRNAVSTGDFWFLFQTWQGYVLLVLGLSVLFLYVSLDLNVKVLYSNNIFQGQHDSWLKNTGRSLLVQARFFNPAGVLVVLYIVLLAPLGGGAMLVSLTRNLYLPRFIQETIKARPLSYAGYIVFLVLVFLAGLIYVFTIHEIVIGKKRGLRAMREARRLFWRNKWDFIREMLLHTLRMVIVFAALGIAVFGIGLILVNILTLPQWLSRLFNIFFSILGILYQAYVILLVTPFYVMKTTELYYRYETGEDVRYRVRRPRDPEMAIVLSLVMIVACLVISGVQTARFDKAFRSVPHTKVIAHRGGGTLGAENTVDGLMKAAQEGVWGSEIDIQRTADGYYIVNHDSTFKRVAGVAKRPQDMTLKEIRELTVRTSRDTGGQPVATLEEMLDASRDRLVLFVELKGATADHRMADDVAAIIEECGMTEQVVVISMKYELISYLETNHPGINTGYLTFALYGKISKLNCDLVGLEEESATPRQIRLAHRAGKELVVWTVNDADSQRNFLLSKADGIITDNVTSAMQATEKLEERSETVLIVETIYHWLYEHIFSL